MADLRVIGVSNNNLELQAPDGSKHTLAISDDLLKALKTRDVKLPMTVSPRDIQHLIRLGATIDEVATKTGADLDLVTRFAKPIIAELNHVVNLARNVRLTLAGDRFADNNPIEFGVVMDERLSNNGAKNISWSACKTNEGEWLISVNFETSNGAGKATWAFEPKQLFLAPENEAALQLSNGAPVTVESKLNATSNQPVLSEPKVEISEVKPTTASLSIVPEPVLSFEDEIFEEEEPVQPVQLRVLPDEPPTEVIEVVAVVEEIEIVEADENETQSAPIEEQETEQFEAPATKPQASSGWAEVLFGSRDDEEEN